MAKRLVFTILAVLSSVLFFTNAVTMNPEGIMQQLYQLGLFRNAMLIGMFFISLGILWKD